MMIRAGWFFSGFLLVLNFVDHKEILGVNGELFTFMAALERLVATEQDVLHLLQDYRRHELEKLNRAREYVKKLSQNYNREQIDAGRRSNYSAVIRGFHSARRHDPEVNRSFLPDLVENSGHFKIEEAVKRLQESQRFPTEDDVKGAALAFQRLQATYKTNAADFADGQLPGARATPPFTASETFLIGKHQATEGYPGTAIPWLEIAARKEEKEEGIITEFYLGVLDWIQDSYFQYSGNSLKALEIARRIKELDPDFGEIDELIRNHVAYLANATEDQKRRMAEPSEIQVESDQEESYNALCRGELQVARRVLRHQRCYYETHGNPFLLLQPVKTEVLYDDPLILILHDVLFESQMERVPSVSYAWLERATNERYQYGVDYGTTQYKGGHIPDSASPVLKEMSDRAALLTNLSGKQSEPLELNNYGMGGFLNLHVDSFTQAAMARQVDHLGNRLGTLMYWITDVEQGGATVFPHLNLTFFPLKGSAVFWYNLHRDGEADGRMVHSGCPVLVGSKWVAVKWFNYIGQDLVRPCGLTKDSPDSTENERKTDDLAEYERPQND